MMQKLHDARIVLGKTPASCSAVTQASDISEDFKAEKKVMKSAANRQWDNVVIRTQLHNVFRATTSFSSEEVKLCINSLLQLSYSAKATLNQHIVVNGYTKFGQQGGSLDFYKIMSACRAPIAPRDLQHMKRQLKQMVVKMKLNTQITEADMDAANIADYAVRLEGRRGNGTPKDQRVIHQRRACVLNHEQTLQYDLQRAQVKAAQPLVRAEKAIEQAQRQLAVAQPAFDRGVAAEKAAAEKREANLQKARDKAAKAAEKANEKELLATMTVQQKNAYRLEKAQQAAEFANRNLHNIGDEAVAMAANEERIIPEPQHGDAEAMETV